MSDWTTWQHVTASSVPTPDLELPTPATACCGAIWIFEGGSAKWWTPLCFSASLKYIRNSHRWCAVIRKPRSAWPKHSRNGPWFFYGLDETHTRLIDCLFVCLFVGINFEKLYSASCVGREVNPLGVITHGQRHKPRAYQRQRHIPRTCQSMVNALHFFFGLESTQLACRVQPKRAQVQAQYWGNPEVAWLEGTPAMLFRSRHSHTQIYKQTRNRTQHTSVIAI